MRRRALVCALVISGCASTNPAGPRGDLSELVEERLGVADAVSIEQDEDAAAAVARRVKDLLSRPLSRASALEIALLNNAHLAAETESLGVAQADLVDAGLLANPTVGGDMIVSTKGNGFGGGFSVTQSLLSAFVIPAQKKVAGANLRGAVLRVGHASLQLARDVQAAYADAATAQKILQAHVRAARLAELGDQLAQAQYDAGNIPEGERAEIGSKLDEARLELAEANVEFVRARESINRLLGLWGADVEWTLPKAGLGAPELPALDDLESAAMRDRLDISVARFDVAAMEAAIKRRRAGVIPNIEVGVEGGNEVGDDEGHEWVIGPSLSLEIPIFNPGHADFARLRAMLRASQHHLRAVAVDARADVREHRAALSTARQRVVYYETTILPRHETIVERALERFNAMLIGAYDLFDVRAERLHAQEGYQEALREYWHARAELELAIGGGLGR